jgi:hypothetical protein
VADVILRCAEKPTREMIAGGAAELMNLARLAPRVADHYREKALFKLTWAEMRPAATVAGLVALMVGALAIANRVSPFE